MEKLGDALIADAAEIKDELNADAEEGASLDDAKAQHQTETHIPVKTGMAESMALIDSIPSKRAQ